MSHRAVGPPLQRQPLTQDYFPAPPPEPPPAPDAAGPVPLDAGAVDPAVPPGVPYDGFCAVDDGCTYPLPGVVVPVVMPGELVVLVDVLV